MTTPGGGFLIITAGLARPGPEPHKEMGVLDWAIQSSPGPGHAVRTQQVPCLADILDPDFPNRTIMEKIWRFYANSRSQTWSSSVTVPNG